MYEEIQLLTFFKKKQRPLRIILIPLSQKTNKWENIK